MAAERSVEYLLGQIGGRLRGIEGRLTHAEESRARTHERLDRVATDIGDIKTEQRKAREDIDVMKPEVELVKGIRYKAAGAIVVLGSLGAIMGVLLTNLWAAFKAGLLKLG